MREQAITIDATTLTDEQVIGLLRSCEAGCEFGRPFPRTGYSISSHEGTRIRNALASGSVLIAEAWRRGLISTPKEEQQG